MNFPPKIRFKFFLEYWPIPFEVLQTCCKIQKYKKFFFVFKKSIRKHIFQNFEYFFVYIYIYKECSKHVRVLVVCNTQEKNIFLYIFFQNANITIRRKHQNGKQQAIIHIIRTTRNLKQFVTKIVQSQINLKLYTLENTKPVCTREPKF